MVNRANPNVPSKFKRKANRSKVQKRNAANGVTKNARGTARSSVIHPTSGPAAPLSAKKARKVEKALNHARKRAIEAQLEADGEVVMTDAPKTTKSKKVDVDAKEENMELDETV